MLSEPRRSKQNLVHRPSLLWIPAHAVISFDLLEPSRVRGLEYKSVMCQRVFQVDYHDYVFKVNMSTSGTSFRRRLGLTSHIRTPLDGKFQAMEIVLVKICLFELSSCTDKITPLNLMLLILNTLIRGTGWGLHLHPTKVSRFFHDTATPQAVARVVSSRVKP